MSKIEVYNVAKGIEAFRNLPTDMVAPTLPFAAVGPMFSFLLSFFDVKLKIQRRDRKLPRQRQQKGGKNRETQRKTDIK